MREQPTVAEMAGAFATKPPERCNATLRTAVVTPCPHGGCDWSPHEHSTCWGDIHVSLATLQCTWDQQCCVDGRHGVEGSGPYQNLTWHDEIPGATPHKPPLVSQAEIEAVDALRYPLAVRDVEAILEAAARAREAI